VLRAHSPWMSSCNAAADDLATDNAAAAASDHMPPARLQRWLCQLEGWLDPRKEGLVLQARKQSMPGDTAAASAASHDASTARHSACHYASTARHSACHAAATNDLAMPPTRLQRRLRQLEGGLDSTKEGLVLPARKQGMPRDTAADHTASHHSSTARHNARNATANHAAASHNLAMPSTRLQRWLRQLEGGLDSTKEGLVLRARKQGMSRAAANHACSTDDHVALRLHGRPVQLACRLVTSKKGLVLQSRRSWVRDDYHGSI